MADVFVAYKFLSDSLGMGLSDEEIAGNERMFKVEWAKSRGYHARLSGSEMERVADDWEFITHLVPRNSTNLPPAPDDGKKSKA